VPGHDPAEQERRLGGRPNLPRRPLAMPNARHMLQKVRQTTVRKARNSVIAPWVDVQADLDAINRGEGVRQGNTFTVNGRTYGVEPNGTAFPMFGAGIHELDRGAYRALGVYNQFGNTPLAEQVLDLERITSEQRRRALDAWQDRRGD
jgi:hypothetical protein